MKMALFSVNLNIFSPRGPASHEEDLRKGPGGLGGERILAVGTTMFFFFLSIIIIIRGTNQLPLGMLSEKEKRGSGPGYQ